MKTNLMTIEQYASNVSFQAYCLKTDEEATRYWTNYLEEHPDQLANIRDAKKIVEFLTLQLSEKEIIAEKEKIKPHFVGMANKNKIQSGSDRMINLRKTMFSIAAVGLLLLSIGVFYLSQKNTIETADYITQTFSIPTEIQLSDGSSVFLAANASIKHEANWKKEDHREVWLTGKALFNVQKNPVAGQQAFIVHTEKGQVEVLGTSFTINEQKGNFEIVLESGKLAFHDHQQKSIILAPGEKLFYQEGQLKKMEVNPAHYSVWKEEQLVFQDTPVEEIVSTLEASFNLNIKVKNKKLLKRKVTASIPKNDPELLLQALSEIYDIQILRSNNEITLK